jgi:hypothetical protein
MVYGHKLSFFMSSNIDCNPKNTRNVLKGFFFFYREFLLLLSSFYLCLGRFIPIMGFLPDLLQFLIDRLRKLKRIEPLPYGYEFLFLTLIDVLTGKEPVQGRERVNCIPLSSQ